MARYLVAVNRNYLKNFKIGKTRKFSTTKRANQTSVISSVIIFDHLLIKSNRERESCRLHIQEFYGSHSIPYVLLECSRRNPKIDLFSAKILHSVIRAITYDYGVIKQ